MKEQLYTLLFRLAGLFRRRRMEASMTEEMQAHLDVLTEANLAAGMPLDEARQAAMRRFGGTTQIQERCRERRGFIWLEQIFKDAAFAVRSLGRARGFTLTILTMLVLGIGVAAFVFDLTAWILVFAQPYPHPEQLYMLGFKNRHSPSNPYQCAVQFQAFQEQTNVFSEFAAVTHAPANAVVEGEPAGFFAIVAAPILRIARTEMNPGLKDSSAAAGSSRAVGRVRTSLVVFQAAFAVVLLAGAGLMVQSFSRLHRTDLGFDPSV